MMYRSLRIFSAASDLALGFGAGATTSANAQQWVIGGNGVNQIAGSYRSQNGYICVDVNGNRRFLTVGQYNQMIRIQLP